MKTTLKIIVHILGLIIVFPLAALYKITKIESIFLCFGQLLSLIPCKIGSYLRVAYYRMVLDRCSHEAYIGFGSFFSHPTAEIGKNVYIGGYCILGKVHIGDGTALGDEVCVLSGRHQHGYNATTSALENTGVFEKILIGESSWIGSNSVIMANVGKHSIVGAGSVVVYEVEDYKVVGGNPAKVIKDLTRTLQ